jgi:hypothetical protein
MGYAEPRSVLLPDFVVKTMETGPSRRKGKVMQLQAVIYSLNTGRVRRWLSTDQYPDEASIKAVAGAVSGEGVLVVPGVADLLTLQAAVTAACGITPNKDRYCHVDALGNVLGATYADPAIDPPFPGCTMQQHDAAGPRWTIVAGVWIPPADAALTIVI